MRQNKKWHPKHNISNSLSETKDIHQRWFAKQKKKDSPNCVVYYKLKDTNPEPYPQQDKLIFTNIFLGNLQNK